MNDTTHKRPTSLTVIIRDDSPLIHLNEPCALRRVTITLTDEQRHQLRLASLGSRHGQISYEEVSTAFLEFD